MRVSGVPFVQGRNGYGDSHKYGVAIHNTSNDASAEGEASYATRRTDGTSSHFYVDNDSIIQSLDTQVRAGHAGSRTGNSHAVAVEITGTNGKTRAWWLANVAWDLLARVLASVCREYGIEPRRASVAEMKANPQVRAFYGHDDMRQAWGGTTHTDPGGNFPWDHLLAKVRQAMNGEDDDMTPEELLGADVLPWVDGAQYSVGGALYDTAKRVIEVRDRLARMETALTVLSGKDFTDEPGIVQGVLAGLSPEAIAAAIPDTLAKQVADELARRLVATETQ